MLPRTIEVSPFTRHGIGPPYPGVMPLSGNALLDLRSSRSVVNFGGSEKRARAQLVRGMGRRCLPSEDPGGNLVLR